MSTDWSIELAPWPFYSQNNSPTADGSVDENAALDCGPTVLSAIIDYLTGVRIYPDTIKDTVLGQGVTGPTSAAQLTNFLRQFTSTKVTAIIPNGKVAGPDSITNLIWEYTVAGKPLIELRQYSASASFLHWTAIIGIDPQYVIRHDPWDGTRRAELYANHVALYRGVLLGVERDRDSNL